MNAISGVKFSSTLSNQAVELVDQSDLTAPKNCQLLSGGKKVTVFVTNRVKVTVKAANP